MCAYTVTRNDNKPSASGRFLRVGNMEMLYDNGSLRYIKVNNEEVLRRIYVALRGPNWETYPPFISNEKSFFGKEKFFISYDCHYEINGTPVFKWEIQMEGNCENELRLHILGKVLESFKKNRAGLCILHPTGSTIGQECEITSPGGKKSRHVFPKFISPHQPFKNIREMQWVTRGNLSCMLQFEGDIFETEDQRNWTDASFKTYSTPLELPFPVLLPKGEIVRQKMLFHIHAPKGVHYAREAGKQKNGCLQFSHSKPLKLPDIGSARPEHKNSINDREVQLIRKLKLTSYRIDLKLSDKTWRLYLQQSVNEARILQTKLEIAVHIGKNGNEIKDFINIAHDIAPMIHKIVLLGSSGITGENDIKKYTLPLRQKCTGVKIGGGTDCYYAELGRNIFDASGLEFISFSINPQVHSFDNLTLIENMESQYDAVISAYELYPDKQIHISTVTLKPRLNPNTTESPGPVNLPLSDTFDPRQDTLFAAGWTLGSFRYLAAARASSVTYYQTTGSNGLITTTDPTGYCNSSSMEKETMVSPVYLLLYLIREFKDGECIAGASREPLKYSGILLMKDKHRRWIIANHFPDKVSLVIEGLSGAAYFRTLNSENKDRHLKDPDTFITSKGKLIQSGVMQLQPYAIGIIDNV